MYNSPQKYNKLISMQWNVHNIDDNIDIKKGIIAD